MSLNAILAVVTLALTPPAAQAPQGPHANVVPVPVAVPPVACPQPDATMLALTLHDFDQTEAGWRSLAGEGCEAVAADAIARYRADNAVKLADEDTGTLDWHEGQMRAAAGQTQAAIAIMQAGLDETTEAIRPYNEATIAFLRRDRAALEAARDRLLALPEPEQFAQARAQYAANYPQFPPLTWPLNRDKVEGFIACFDRPYREAYGCDAQGNVQ